MEPPEGVDFHASYDQVPKAKVKIPRKLKVKKNLNYSCPSFGFVEKANSTTTITTKGPKHRMRKGKRSQSATVERQVPTRSLSFTSSPPQHLDIETPKPKPMPLRRTKSLLVQPFLPIGGRFEKKFNDVSVSLFSSDGAFKPLHSSASSFSAGPFEAANSYPVPLQTTNHMMHQSFPVIATDSAEFVRTPLAPQEKSKELSRGRKHSKNSSTTKNENVQNPRRALTRSKSLAVVPLSSSVSSVNSEQLQKRDSEPMDDVLSGPGDVRLTSRVPEDKSKQLRRGRRHSKTSSRGNESTRSPRAPIRSNSLQIAQVSSSISASTPKRLHSLSVEKVATDDTPTTPRHRPSLPPRSKSLSELGVRIPIFKAPAKDDVSKRASPRRKLSHRAVSPPETPRRKKVVVPPIPSSPGRNSKGTLSPRRVSRRSAFLVRSKSARMMESSGSIATLESESRKVSTLNPPRRVISVYAGPKSRSPSSERQRPGMHSTDADHGSHLLLDDSFSISASDVVPVATFLYSKNTAQNKPQINNKTFKDTLNLVGKWKRKAKKDDGNHASGTSGSVDRKLHVSKLDDSRTPETSLSSEERSSSKRLSKKQTKEARLESYMAKTPESERKKVDHYWIEAFKRNYATRRSDHVYDGRAGS